jgi:hypothetical protein
MSFRFSIATGATIGATFARIAIISRQAGATGARLVDGTAITRGLAIGAHGDAFWSGRCGFARNSKARLTPGFFFSIRGNGRVIGICTNAGERDR